jgi:type II secretory pathway pseudopilin PulG
LLHHAGKERGAVLLEVVLALALFVLAATIITSGLSSSINEVKRLRLNTHANNLAASVLSQIQMGVQPGESSGPNTFDPPFDQWTWQTTIGPINEMVGATNPIQKVEVVIRHQTEPVLFRLTQFLPVAAASGSSPGSPNPTPPAGGGS